MIYLDTSAAVKALVAEPGSGAVTRLFAADEPLISSRLLAVELHAVAVRRGVDIAHVEALLDRVALASIDDDIVADAIALRSGLRTLDSLHLATALSLGGIVTEFAAFDIELNEAAQRAGIDLTTWSAQP